MNKNLLQELNMRPHYTISDSIPMKSIYEDGVVEVRKGLYSKTYKIDDINFNLSRTEDKIDIYLSWLSFLSSFDINERVQLTIVNHIIDSDAMLKDVLLSEVGDDLDGFREEYNKIVRGNVQSGNNIVKDKYITIAQEADNLKDARRAYQAIEEDALENLERAHIHVKPLKLMERLNLLREMYNPSIGSELIEEYDVNGQSIPVFDLNNLYAQGLDIKNYIAPSVMEFNKRYFRIGSKYGKCLSIIHLPSSISDKLFTSLVDRDFDCTATVNMKKIDKATAFKLVHNKLVNIEGEVVDQLSKSNTVSYTTQQNHDDTSSMLDDLTLRDQDLWEVQLHILVYGDTLEEVDKHLNTIKTKCRSHGIAAQKVSLTIEQIFNSCLPLGVDQSGVKRTLTTDAAAGFLPFSAQDLRQKTSSKYKPQYYGVNIATKSVIAYSRSSGDSYNMLRFGFTGSGKSLTTKFHELSSFLSDPNADIIVIDPLGEYGALCSALNGQVIKITGSGTDRINPFDINSFYSISENIDPVANKIDFIISMISIMYKVGNSAVSISSLQQTEIVQAAKEIYRKWRDDPTDENIPTMQDFYNELMEFEINSLDMGQTYDLQKTVERYTENGGSDVLFSNKTNIDLHNRYVVFDISGLGDNLKELAMLVILEYIYQRACANAKQKKITYLDIDEVHLFFNSDNVSRYFSKIWKVGRHLLLYTCGITQNVTNLLNSETGRDMIKNTAFIQLLKQSDDDANKLGAILNLSDSELAFVHNTPPGHGLMSIAASQDYPVTSVIPFRNPIPLDSLIFDLINTKIIRDE